MRKLFPFLLFLAAATAFAQNPPYAPDRRPGEGEGPFQRLIIRGATGIYGTGAPPSRPACNEIVAPRTVPNVFPARLSWAGGPIDTPEQARKFVQWASKKGFDGLKVFAGPDPIFQPDILAALLDEANKLHLGSTTHLAQMGVAESNILSAARLGLRGMEHWYGLPESL